MTERKREKIELIDYETDRLRIGENIDIKDVVVVFVVVVAFILCLTNPLFCWADE